jgi:signal transduction histidine kinase
MTTQQYTMTEKLCDMRSPLSALILSLDMLEGHKVGLLNKTQHELLKGMRESVEKLRHAIDQSLFISVCK